MMIRIGDSLSDGGGNVIIFIIEARVRTRLRIRVRVKGRMTNIEVAREHATAKSESKETADGNAFGQKVARK